jgi:hypothetical protein
MIHSAFCVGGAITEDQANCYIQRDADKMLFDETQQMHYTLVVEPRQQGKTSLANHLMRCRMPGFLFVYLDLTTLDQTSEQNFYTSFRRRFLEHLDGSLTKKHIESLRAITDFRDFLYDVSKYMEKNKLKLVIILDEVGAVRFQNSTLFFSILRDIYNSRQVQPELKCISFMLVGAFHPNDLIQDKRISPFNIAHRVRLPDFESTQIVALLGIGPWSQKQLQTLSNRVYHWTSGQPYPVQYICSRLQVDATSDDVDRIVRLMREEDGNLIPPVLDKLREDISIHEYLKSILNGVKIKYVPGMNKSQAQLELLGLIKSDAKGFCMIRSLLYQEVLRDYYAGFDSISENKVKETLSKPLHLLQILFVKFPQQIGYFLLDVFKRENARPSTAILVGYLTILLLFAMLRGFLRLDDIIAIFRKIQPLFSSV